MNADTEANKEKMLVITALLTTIRDSLATRRNRVPRVGLLAIVILATSFTSAISQPATGGSSEDHIRALSVENFKLRERIRALESTESNARDLRIAVESANIMFEQYDRHLNTTAWYFNAFALILALASLVAPAYAYLGVYRPAKAVLEDLKTGFAKFAAEHEKDQVATAVENLKTGDPSSKKMAAFFLAIKRDVAVSQEQINIISEAAKFGADQATRMSLIHYLADQPPALTRLTFLRIATEPDADKNIQAIATFASHAELPDSLQVILSFINSGGNKATRFATLASILAHNSPAALASILDDPSINDALTDDDLVSLAHSLGALAKNEAIGSKIQSTRLYKRIQDSPQYVSAAATDPKEVLIKYEQDVQSAISKHGLQRRRDDSVVTAQGTIFAAESMVQTMFGLKPVEQYVIVDKTHIKVSTIPEERETTAHKVN